MKIQTQTSTYTPVPEGQHQAVLVDWLDYGFPQNDYQGELKPPVPVTEFVFQIADTNDYGERYEIRSKRQNILWGGKANFPKFLAQIVGVKGVDKIRDSGELDLDELLGTNVWLSIEHVEKERQGEKRVYAEITNIMAFNPKQGPILEPDNYVLMRNRKGYRPPEPSINDDNEERVVSETPTFVRANGEIYFPAPFMVYQGQPGIIEREERAPAPPKRDIEHAPITQPEKHDSKSYAKALAKGETPQSVLPTSSKAASEPYAAPVDDEEDPFADS